MQRMRAMFLIKPVALYLAFACFIIASIPANSWAYFVDSQVLNSSREADMDKIQRVLESKMVSQRLSELGLSMDEINSKLHQLNDADVHQFASQLDSLMPGGADAGVTIIFLLVIAVLVLVILQLMGYKILIK